MEGFTLQGLGITEKPERNLNLGIFKISKEIKGRLETMKQVQERMERKKQEGIGRQK